MRPGPVSRGILFAALAGAGMWVTLFGAIDGLKVSAIAATARATSLLLSLCGGAASIDGAMVRSRYGDVQIIYECTGVFPAIILTAAMLSFPAAWRAKCVGVGAGILAVVAVNQLRIVTLIMVGRIAPGAMETAHHFVWPALILMSTAFLFAQWAAWAVRAEVK